MNSPASSAWESDRTALLVSLFMETRQRTLSLAAPLSPEDCALQSMPDASPVKWHLAHTSWFFETFLLEKRADYQVFDPAFRVLYNSYYVGVGERHARAERGLISRPSLTDVLRYRNQVEQGMLRALEAGFSIAELDLVELGINHEEQHQELILTDLKHLFSKNPLHPAYQPNWPLTPIEARKPNWIAFAEGVHEIGHTGKGFAFDNEGPRHREYSQAFELSTHPVTHGEFMAFVEDGGYERPELWLSAGWDCRTQQGWRAPFYWERHGDAWHTFTLHGMAPVDPHTPICHVSFYEADAFARWAGARLPTEAEWERAAAGVAIDGNFLESGAYHPLALRQPAAEGSLSQLYGDVWEWTQSDYRPYPGFKTASGAVGEYNGKFMTGQYVLRGGSCATPRRHIRASYRNFFPPSARWQFSGLRLARDIAA
jgi:ergothioneine biosynthesis protein EgtB